MTIREKVFRIIETDSGKENYWSTVFDRFIVLLIFISIIQVILESFESIHDRYSRQFWDLELFIVIIFTIEYLLRVWTADLKYPGLSWGRAAFKWMTSWAGIVDLLAILPFYLPFFLDFDLRAIRILRVTRLLRVLKLNRYFRSFQIVGAVAWEKRSELGITLFVTFILILLSSTIMWNLEHEVQPDAFPNIVATFWWAVATLTTVGYGDVYPITGWGKLISGVIALLGIGLVALPTGIISAAFFEEIAKREEESTETEPAEPAAEAHPGKAYKYCPHCGERLGD